MHFDLWAGTDACGIVHAKRWLAATYSRWRRLPEFGGRQRPSRGPCHFVRPLGEAPRPGGVRKDVFATLMETLEPFATFCSPSSFRLGDYAAEHAESVLSLCAT